MMLKGCTIAGIIYTRKRFVNPRFFIVINMGISPALKYMVITMSLYHSFLCHSFGCVNIKPRKAEASTVQKVPTRVLATDTTAAVERPASFRVSL